MAIRPDQMTVRATQALAAAQEMATSAGNPELTSLHLLSALLNEDEGGVVVPLLQKVGAVVDRARSITASELGRAPKSSGGSLAMSRELNDVLAAAQREADRLKDKYLSTEHLLLAMTDTPCQAKEVLSLCGADHKAILAGLKE